MSPASSCSWGGVLVVSLAMAPLSCASPPISAPPPLPTQGEWHAARASLDELRASEPTRPFGAIVQVSLREPHTHQSFTARGAVAVDPHRAVRMILVGPGGATALDIWATHERWRFEVPAVKLLRRGGRDDDPSLPIGFFRWWFLAPLGGRLLTSVAGRAGERFILRDGVTTVDLADAPGPRGHTFTASRRADRSTDRVVSQGASFSAVAGDCATYDEDSTGVHVEVTVEAPSDAPDPAAFTDPDVVAESDVRRDGASEP